MIRAENLVKRFSGITALDGVSFSVAPGEILGFLGPNGAGKSTALRLLSGWMPPTSGTASINGFDLVQDSLLARAAIGYLPENFSAPIDMRVGEYLSYRAELKGLRPAAARNRAQEAASEFALADRWRQSFGTLSKGYRQRVGLADALLADPPALLLDEPFTGLDPVQRQEFKKALHSLAQRGKAILFSSHVLPEVQDLVSRVLILHRGRAAAAGTLTELQERLRSASPLRIQAAGPNSAAAISAIAAHHGFHLLQAQADGSLLLRADDPAQRPALLRALAAANVEILEFHTPEPDLEQLFLLLVREEAA
jgi:ABC-2 type transport system ATP-binding protein